MTVTVREGGYYWTQSQIEIGGVTLGIRPVGPMKYRRNIGYFHDGAPNLKWWEDGSPISRFTSPIVAEVAPPAGKTANTKIDAVPAVIVREGGYYWTQAQKQAKVEGTPHGLCPIGPMEYDPGYGYYHLGAPKLAWNGNGTPTAPGASPIVAEAMPPGIVGKTGTAIIGDEIDAGVAQPDIKAQIADEAKRIVTGDRRGAYGTPEQNFERIARFWQAYFENTGRADVKITAADVSPLMRLMKEARLCESPRHYDSHVDLVGYTLTGAEVNGVSPLTTVKPSA